MSTSRAVELYGAELLLRVRAEYPEALWIAADSGGSIFVYNHKPVRQESIWMPTHRDDFTLISSMSYRSIFETDNYLRKNWKTSLCQLQ